METKELKNAVESKNTVAIIEAELGLGKSDQERIAKRLGVALATSYHLLLKTHNYHWNVRGPLFKQIHDLTEDNYKAIFKSIDVIAERIRALGALVNADLERFHEKSILSNPSHTLNAEGMIADLVSSHEAISREYRNFIEMCGEAGDEGTADMLTAEMRFHEKTAWLLRSFLEQ